MEDDQTKHSSGVRHGAKRIGGILILALIAVIFLVGGAVFYIRIGMTGDDLARMLVPTLERELGWRISFSSARLAWPSATRSRLTVVDVECRNASDDSLCLRTRRMVFEVSLFPRSCGFVLINRAHFSNPIFYLPATADTGTSGSPIKRRSGLGSLVVCPFIRNVEVEKGAVVLPGSPKQHVGSKVILQRVRGVAKNIGVSGVENLAITGELEGPAGHGYFDITGRVSSTPLSRSPWSGRLKVVLSDCPVLPIRLLASHFGWSVPLSQGTINLRLEMDGRMNDGYMRGAIWLSHAIVEPARMFHGPVPIEKASARFSADLRKDSLSLHLTEAHVPGLDLSADVKGDRLSQKNGTLTVAVKKAVVDLAKLFPLVPVELLKAEDRDRLLGAGLTGRMLVTGASWSGRISRLLEERGWEGTLEINAVLEKVSAFLPGLGLPIQNASGRVRMNSDEMLFESIDLTVGKSPIRLHGFIADLRSDPRIELFVATKAMAQDLVPLLQNRPVARQLPSMLSRIEDPHGGITVELDLDGRLRHPKIKGHVVLDNFQCRVAGFPAPLHGISGALKFKKQGFTVPSLVGYIGETPARVQGSVSPEKIGLSLEAKLASADLKKLDMLPAGWNWSGKIPLKMNVEGTPSAPNFSFRADMKQNGVRIGYVVKKRPGIPLSIEASGIKEYGEIKIEEAYLIAGRNRIAVKGSIKEKGLVTLLMSLPPKGIQTDDLIPLAHPSLEIRPGGRIEGDGVIKAGPNWSQNLNVDADLSLHHVTLLLGFHKPLSGVTGTIRLRNGVFYGLLDRAKIGSSFFSGNVSIAGWKNPEVRVNLKSSFLDTADFGAPPGYVSKVTWREWIRRNATIRFLARCHGSATIEVARGKASGRLFSHFSTTVEGKSGLLTLPSWKINIADGIVRGTARFDIRANTTRPLTVDFQADHLRMERMLLADPERVKIEGDTLMNGHMEWNLTSKRENDGVYKTGAIEVRVRDGTIHRFDILSKIFSLINLGSIVRGRLPDVIAEGLPFNRLTWDMEVFGTKWKIKNLVLLSDAAHIAATGMYFSDQGRVDFKVDVSPLVGFDKIVSGLFGNLITRNGKILTTTFRIRGLYQSPDVRLEPLESLGSQ